MSSSTFFCIDSVVVPAFIARFTGTTTDGENAPIALGTTVKGNKNTIWVFTQANGAIGINDWITYDENFQAAALTKANVDAGHTVGLCGGLAAFADNEFGFVCKQTGNSGIQGNVASGTAADVALYTTTTAGRLSDDTSAAGGTAQTKIEGVAAVSAASADTVTPVGAILTYPRGL